MQLLCPWGQKVSQMLMNHVVSSSFEGKLKVRSCGGFIHFLFSLCVHACRFQVAVPIFIATALNVGEKDR